MDARLEQTPPVRDFALAIGEWLLAQRFGAITPLAFRYRLWESRDPCPGELPHVVIDLLVNDPPPPPPEWHRLKDMKKKDMSLAEIGEWAQGQIWPRADMDAVREATEAYAAGVGVPGGIDRTWPVHVNLVGCSDAGECGFPAVND